MWLVIRANFAIRILASPVKYIFLSLITYQLVDLNFKNKLATGLK